MFNGKIEAKVAVLEEKVNKLEDGVKELRTIDHRTNGETWYSAKWVERTVVMVAVTIITGAVGYYVTQALGGSVFMTRMFGG